MSSSHLKRALEDESGVTMDFYLEDTATFEIMADIKRYADSRANIGALMSAVQALESIIDAEKTPESGGEK